MLSNQLSDIFNSLLEIYHLIREEVIKSDKIYGKKDAHVIKKWLKKSFKDKAYFDYVAYQKISKIIPLAKKIKKGTKILDVGCGFGSDAIICGILCANVLGIDINKEYITVAEKRLNYYNNNLDIKINVKFELKNVFKQFGTYDLIWASQAISHITPQEKFVEHSYNNLKLRGNLIISDENKLNPHRYLYARKMQKEKGVFLHRIDPDTGEDLLIPNEFFFSIKSIKSILSNYFKITEISRIGYIPFFAFSKFKKISKKLESELFERLPFIKKFAGSYVITGNKIK